MAKALRCPMCGHPHPLQNYTGVSTFPCENCGQALKIPGAAASMSAPSEDTNANTRLVWRPPATEATAKKSATMEIGAAPPVPHAAAGTSGASATAVLPRTRVEAGPKDTTKASPKRQSSKPADTQLPVAWRVLSWIIGVLSALILVIAPLKVLGLFSKTRIADILLGASVTRFIPLVLFIVLWAFATTIVVQLFTMLLLRLTERRLTTT